MISEEPDPLGIFLRLSLGESVAESVRAFTSAVMKSDGQRASIVEQQAMRRARWLRNKRAQRSREKPMAPPPLPRDVEASVWEERDRRRRDYPQWAFCHCPWTSGKGNYDFLTDVWAVRALLLKQHQSGRVTAGMVARRMTEIGLSHGFKPTVLRTMVYRAYGAIAFVEGKAQTLAIKTAWSAESTSVQRPCFALGDAVVHSAE